MSQTKGQKILTAALVVFVVLDVVAVAAAIKFNSDLEKEIAKAKEYKTKADRVGAEAKRLIPVLDEAERVVNADGGIVQYSAYQDDILKTAKTKIDQALAGEWVTAEELNNIKDQRIRTTWQTLLEFKSVTKDYKNLAELYSDLIKLIRNVIHLIPRLHAQREAKIREYNEAVRKFDANRRSFREQTSVIEKKYRDEQDKGLAIARDFDQTKRKLEDQINKITTQQKRFAKIKKLEIARLESEKNSLKQEIKELIKKERKTFEISAPDGRIVFSEPSLNSAWINIGKREGVKAGTVFQVFRYVKGGRKRIKGKVLVKLVEETMAKVTILRNTEIQDFVNNETYTLPREHDPIVKGDLIRNPIFDKAESKVFVFVGTKLKNNEFKQKEIEKIIEGLGGRVDKQIGINTNFVIKLANADEEYADELERAAQYGTIFITEAELVQYLK